MLDITDTIFFCSKALNECDALPQQLSYFGGLSYGQVDGHATNITL